MTSYFAPTGGHQDKTGSDRPPMFTEAYAVIPKGTMRDITTSFLPFWDNTRLWVIARPLTGFAETFSHYIMEVGPGGGSDRAETDPEAEGVLFVVEGAMSLTVDGETHKMTAGGYAYLPLQSGWTLRNTGSEPARFHWLRKAYQAVDGLEHPQVIVTNEADVAPTPMPGTDGKWATTRFVDPADLRHDMPMSTVVTFRARRGDPVCRNPCDGTRAITCSQGKAVYRLNQDLGRGRGRRLHVAARLSARRPVMRRGPGPFPLSAL